MDPFNDEHMKMYFYENRLKTFEGWPFEEGCLCTPENVSARIFRHVRVWKGLNPSMLTEAKTGAQRRVCSD